MPDEPTAPVEEPTVPDTPAEDVVPAARFQEVAKHKKAADAKVKELERKMADMQSALEEREHAGLPELERERKQREKLERELEKAQERIEQATAQQARSQRERLVLAAASRARFDDAGDALRFPEYVNLDEIETLEDAERAVKKLAKAKPKLLADEDRQLPGQVLNKGQAPAAPGSPRVPGTTGAGSALGLVNTDEEAQAVASALAEFRKSRAKTSITFDGT